MKKSRINKNNLARAIRESKKSKIFSIFTPLLRNISLAKKNNFNEKSFSSYCFQHYRNRPIVEDFAGKFNAYCRRQLLRYLTAKTINFNKVEEAFQKSLPNFLNGEHKSYFSKFLKKLRKNKKTKLLVYEHLKNAISEDENLPSIKLLTELDYDIHWTRSLQSLSSNNPTKKRVFTQEFKKLKRLFYRRINRDKILKAIKYKDQLISFYRGNSSFISKSFALKSLLAVSNKLLTSKLYNESKKTYDQIELVFKLDNHEEILFKKLWIYLDQKKLLQAHQFIKKNRLISKFDNFSPKLQFWIADTLNKNGEEKVSAGLFLSIIESRPLHYYSILSYKSLPENHKKSINFVVNSNMTAKQTKNKKQLFSNSSRKYLKRISIWSKHKRLTFIEKELEGLFNLPKKKIFSKKKISRSLSSEQLDNILIQKITKTLNSFGEYLPSFKMIYKGLSEDKVVLSDDILKALFPKSYFNKISKIESDLDPYFVLSLIRQESAFNPIARSTAGARGLMQLMPNTAKLFKKRIRSKHLENPKLNLQIGIKYLKKLVKMFDGNLIYTLAAYNAGENRVIRWRKKIFTHNDPLLTIESIPFQETRNYVKLIYRNIFFYNLIYENKSNIKDPLEESFKISLNQTLNLK